MEGILVVINWQRSVQSTIKHLLTCPLMLDTRPPYCNLGGGNTRPRTSIILFDIVKPNSCT